MSIEANKETARRASELYNSTASPEVIDSLFAPELLVHYPHRTLDFAAVKASFTRPARDFTEARNVVEDIKPRHESLYASGPLRLAVRMLTLLGAWGGGAAARAVGSAGRAPAQP